LQSEKIEKWRKIAVEASKQCGCNIITDICDVMDFGDILKSVGVYGLRFGSRITWHICL